MADTDWIGKRTDEQVDKCLNNALEIKIAFLRFKADEFTEVRIWLADHGHEVPTAVRAVLAFAIQRMQVDDVIL